MDENVSITTLELRKSREKFTSACNVNVIVRQAVSFNYLLDVNDVLVSSVVHFLSTAAIRESVFGDVWVWPLSS